MSTTRSLRFATLIAALLLSVAAFAQTDAEKAFTAIKTLPGTWEGKDHRGQALQVTYKTISGGSAVMSEIMGAGPEDMITMFHLDGSDRLLATHYCSAGNQPRMQASVSPDGKTITFNFVDGTSIASPESGHMRNLVLTLVDENHHTEDWTYVDHGKERKEFFDLRRKM